MNNVVSANVRTGPNVRSVSCVSFGVGQIADRTASPPDWLRGHKVRTMPPSNLLNADS